MFWSSMEEDSTSSSSDSDEYVDTISSNQDYNDDEKIPVQVDDKISEEELECQNAQILCRPESNSSPFVQVLKK